MNITPVLSTPAAFLPEDRTFATKSEAARSLVLRALASDLPIAWVAAESAYGDSARMLEEAGVGYVLAVPKTVGPFAGQITTATHHA
ncbi:hypothetical protein AB0I23_31205 [Streptomyces atratus]